MDTKICPTCGCSLVRLGIADARAKSTTFNSKEYFFCCQGCLDQFLKNPEPFLEELADLHVCPACLAEKPTAQTISVAHGDQEIRLCRCTHCKEVFEENPTYYLDRLSGKVEFRGLFDDQENACC